MMAHPQKIAPLGAPSAEDGSSGGRSSSVVPVREKRFRAKWVSIWSTPERGTVLYFDEKVQELVGKGVPLVCDRHERLAKGDEVKDFYCSRASDCKCRFRARWRFVASKQSVEVQTLHNHDHTPKTVERRASSKEALRAFVTDLRHKGVNPPVIVQEVWKAVEEDRLRGPAPSETTIRKICYQATPVHLSGMTQESQVFQPPLLQSQDLSSAIAPPTSQETSPHSLPQQNAFVAAVQHPDGPTSQANISDISTYHGDPQAPARSKSRTFEEKPSNTARKSRDAAAASTTATEKATAAPPRESRKRTRNDGHDRVGSKAAKKTVPELPAPPPHGGQESAGLFSALARTFRRLFHYT